MMNEAIAGHGSENNTDIKEMLQQMSGMPEDQRRAYFQYSVLPGFKFISPMERDHLIELTHSLLKSSGVAKPTIRKMVEDEVRPLKKVKDTGKVVNLPPAAKVYNRSDVGNAQRLVDEQGGFIRYCDKWNTWLIWDGQRWVADEKGLVRRMVHGMAYRMQQEALQIQDIEARKEAFNWAISLEKVSNIENLIKAARDLQNIPVGPDEFDRDPWLFNVRNGTLNLRTGELQEHKQEDLISKLAPVSYDPDAQAPTWEAFLDRIMDGNKELITYVKRALGYSLTGITQEQEFYLCWGTGSNGKSVFIETIKGMLGDYAASIPADRLTVTGSDSGPTPELARLLGIRFVSSQESDNGKALREAFIKSVTGGDSVVARYLHCNPFEFKPIFKLWFSTNFKPEIKSGGHGLWRRVRLIPFAVTIPPKEQDKRLPEKLQKEWPGILRWCVEGCLEWQKYGLTIPEEVQKATESYRQEMDYFEQFLEECCLIKPFAQVTNKKLRGAYDKWCQSNGERPLRQNEFSGRLVEKGLKNERTRDGFLWKGIGLLDVV